MSTTTNHDPAEIARFEQIARSWWDPHGEFRPLHAMNPVRADYIAQRVPLSGKTLLDIGCGGGLLSEAMAQRGAQVTGIDLGETTIEVAELHALESGAKVNYVRESAEQHLQSHAGEYDVVTCLELLEHVPDPAALAQTIAQLLKPGGQAFFSTLNRNPKSYAIAVLGAEYVLKLLPRGTHTYSQFIRPSELARWARAAGFEVADIRGMSMQPFTMRCGLSRDVEVNYLMHVIKSVEVVPLGSARGTGTSNGIGTADRTLTNGASPRTNSANPRIDGASPRTNGASPRPNSANPRIDGTNPRTNGASPRIDGASPRLNGASPRPKPRAPSEAEGQLPK